MELDHLHIHKFSPGPETHGHAITGLIKGGCRYLVHGGRATRGNDGNFGIDDKNLSSPDIGEYRPHDSRSIF